MDEKLKAQMGIQFLVTLPREMPSRWAIIYWKHEKLVNLLGTEVYVLVWVNEF